MKQVDSNIYDTDYYLNVCLGSEEFKRTNGKQLNVKWKRILNYVDIKPGMKILDLGCGRGEAVFYLAQKGAEAVGIDYSKDAIRLANNSLKNMPKKVRRLVKFKQIDAKKLNFKKNNFDVVISFDVFEHLYKEELEIVLRQISRVLKRDGVLLVHTETNKIYLDYTHPYLVYPFNLLILKIYNSIFKKNYIGFPKDLRNEYHKKQHVNEPTIFYLKKIFNTHYFKGRIIQYVGIYKPIISWKDLIYNLIVCLYPFSRYFPLNIFYATEYICIMKNKKI